MKMSKILMAGTLLALGATTAHAASDGGLAATSTGTSDVQLIVAERVQITGLTDLILDNGSGGTANTYEPGSGDVSFTSTFCVHYNNATGVDLTINSTNGAGAGYILDDGSGNQITYQVEIDEGDDGGATAHAEAATIQYSAMASTTLNCGGTPNNNVRAFVLDSGSPLGVPNGTYQDTLSFIVAPNP